MLYAYIICYTFWQYNESINFIRSLILRKRNNDFRNETYCPHMAKCALHNIYKRSFELPRVNDCIVNNVPFDILNKQKLKRPEFRTIYFSLMCMYTKLLYCSTYKLVIFKLNPINFYYKHESFNVLNITCIEHSDKKRFVTIGYIFNYYYN